MAGFYGRTGIEFGGNLEENLGALAAKVRPAAIAAATAGAEQIQQLAYSYANVSPGVMGHGVNGEHMRDEIKIEIREYAERVVARVQIDMAIIPYAAHQEFGPHGNAFMRRAVDESRDAAHDTMKQVFSAEMGADGVVKVRTQVRMRNFA